MSPDEERDGDNAFVRGFGNVVALGGSKITIFRFHVSAWILAVLVPLAVLAAFLVFKWVEEVVPEVMDGSFNFAVADFEQPDDGAKLSDDEMRLVSETVSDHLKERVGQGVVVWSADQTGIEHAFTDREAVVDRAGEIRADAVLAAFVTPISEGRSDGTDAPIAPSSASIEFRIHAFGDAAADRAAPPLTLDYIVASEGEFELDRLIQLEDLVDAVALDDVVRALELIDNDDFWEAADVIRRATEEHQVDLQLLEGLNLLRWSAAEQTRGQPTTAAPPAVAYVPPPEGLLTGASDALEGTSASEARDLFLLDVTYLDYLLDGRDEDVTSAEWADLSAGYTALDDCDDALREVYVALMRGQIAVAAEVDGQQLEGADARADFERIIEISDAQDNTVFDPFESGAWVGVGLLDLTSTPPDLPDAIESFENGRTLASPAFRVRYSNPLALALILDDQACEALAVLEEATADATRIGAVLPPEHDELVARANAGCPSVG